MTTWIFALIFISLTPLSSSVSIYQQCGGDGYTGSTQCDWPLGCFRRSHWFSSCQTTCPGGDWECATLVDNSNAAGLAKAWEQCGGEGWNGPRGCIEYPCQSRSQWYAQCRPDCPAEWLCQGSASGSTAQTVSPTAGPTDLATDDINTVFVSMPIDGSSSTDSSISATPASTIDDSSEAIFGRYIVSAMLGSDAHNLDTDSIQMSETPALIDTITNHIITIAEIEEPGSMAEFGAALQADTLDERLKAWENMRDRIETISEGPELAMALMQEPLFVSQMQPTTILENLGVNVRRMRIGTGACDGPTPDIGKVNGLYGSERKSVMEVLSGGIKIDDPTILARIDLGMADAPDPESRLGAYYATRNYGPDTVGRAVHRAIGAIYLTIGSDGEEKIGRVFNSEAAKALYEHPVTSSSSLCMAEIEHQYWANVKMENPDSFGGTLGRAFSPRVRDCIQKLLSFNLCRSAKSRSVSMI